ncbi:SPASM domain-containing protein [Candidatus Parcubacteria bacterium]|nr:SPASM domain-containing protein [Candidatus Parcubacteria bacterium]
MKKYRISRFVKTFQYNEVVAVYHSTNMELLFFDQISAEKIIKRFKHPNDIKDRIFQSSKGTTSQDIISFLIEKQFLVPWDYDEVHVFQKQVQKLQRERFIRVMYLMLTDDCNFQCTYCFQNKDEIQDLQATRMRKDVCQAAIELLSRMNQKYPINPKREITIELYGGEPLLNFPALVVATLHTEYLIKKNRLPVNTKLAMVTNGSLVTPEIAEFIAEHQISIGVSIDGPGEIHDVYRISKNGKGTSQRAIAAYRMLQKAGAEVGISCTLTPLVVDHFTEILDFFEYELGLQNGLAFNILHYNPKIPVDKTYYKKAAECLLESFSRFRDKGIWEERMMRKAQSFAYRKIMFADCAAIGHQLVISPDGKIGICPDFIKSRRFFNNSVFDKSFDPYQNKDFQEWLRRSPLNMPQCLDCEAIAICGGGCPASAEAHYGSMWDVDQRICPHSKKALEWLIWDTYQRVKQPLQNTT